MADLQGSMNDSQLCYMQDASKAVDEASGKAKGAINEGEDQAKSAASKAEGKVGLPSASTFQEHVKALCGCCYPSYNVSSKLAG